jgi:far upstream element-binding protein
MIESSLVGLVIGRQGENLRRIETESNTRIQFITGPEQSGPQRQCRITGPVRARNDAKREIYRIIDENGGNAPRDVPQARSVTSSGSGGKQRGSNQPPLREGENSVQIMVPDRTVGLIIGRGGETIRDLQERSGCHINIVGENKSVNGLRPVNLIGNTQAANLAKEFILEIVDSDTRNQEGQQQQSAPRAVQPTHDQHGGGNRDRGDRDAGKITENILVPSEAVGMIIGKGNLGIGFSSQYN